MAREQRPLVTCVIPTYGRTATLVRAVQSVLTQTVDDLEVVVVDDNVPDSPAQREVELLLKGVNDPRLRILRPGRHGNGAIARNIGIEEASGSVVGFLDDDDEWLPSKLETQLPLLESRNVAALSSWHRLARSSRVVEYCRQVVSRPTKLDILTRRVALTTPSLLVPRSVLDRGVRFDERLRRHQDIQFVLDLLDFGDVWIVPDYLVQVHIDDGSNRPTLSQLKSVKADFFLSVERHFAQYDPKAQRRILAAHSYELAYSAAKERDFGALLPALAAGLQSIRSLDDLATRARLRRQGRRFAEMARQMYETG